MAKISLNQTPITFTSASSTDSFSYNCPVGTDALYVGVYADTGAGTGVSGITYNSTSMVKLSDT